MDGDVRRFAVPAGLGAPREARRIVAALDGVPATLRGDVQLVVSELVTNAVRHGGLRDGDPIMLMLGCEDGRLRVDVDDGGETPWTPRPGGPGGWGLAAVAALSERWEGPPAA